MKDNKKLEKVIKDMIEDTYKYHQVTKPGISLEQAIEDAVKRGYKLGKEGKVTKPKAYPS